MTDRLRFRVYDRWTVDVRRGRAGGWVAYAVGEDGKRSRLRDLVIPDEASPEEIADMIDVEFHELARPGQEITRLPGG